MHRRSRDRSYGRPRERSLGRDRDRSRDARPRDRSRDDRFRDRSFGRAPDRDFGRRSRSRGRSGSGGRARSRSLERPNVGKEKMTLDPSEIAYLLGRSGTTKNRLSNFSGARFDIKGVEAGGVIEIIGTPEERELARLCVDITLQQRNAGKVACDVVALETRRDICWLDVPNECVGFIMGAKGATLRGFEQKYRTFMFFDTEVVRDNKKRLYILGPELGRQGALKECESALIFKLSGSGSLKSWSQHNLHNLNRQQPVLTRDMIRQR